jgi:hypothetical protein
MVDGIVPSLYKPVSETELEATRPVRFDNAVAQISLSV